MHRPARTQASNTSNNDRIHHTPSVSLHGSVPEEAADWVECAIHVIYALIRILDPLAIFNGTLGHQLIHRLVMIQ